MSFNCPQCQSEQTQKISAIYSAGTSSATSYNQDKITGTILGAGQPGLVTGSRSSTTHSYSQSLLASQFSQPKKKVEFSLPLLVVIAIGQTAVLLFLVACVLTFLSKVIQSDNSAFKFLLFVVVFCAPYPLFKRMQRKDAENKLYNQTHYAEQMTLWQKGFYCHKCENIFIPNN